MARQSKAGTKAGAKAGAKGGAKAGASGGAGTKAGAGTAKAARSRRKPPPPLVKLDPTLGPFADTIRRRQEHHRQRREAIEAAGGLTGSFSRAHEHLGFHRGERDGRAGVWYREWAPGAEGLWLIGDFNGWDRGAHPLERGDEGVWSIFLPDGEAGPALSHGQRVKVHVRAANGELDRVPPYVRRAVQDERTLDFAGQYWLPETPYEFRHDRPTLEGGLRIYEAHVGLAQERDGIGTFNEFVDRVLPRIEGLGYNAIQLMAIAEHPYYGSGGYQVSNFFAVSSRFGTPEELKRLIDEAHGRGLLVIMDLIHSHAVRNVNEGLHAFDGTGEQYFHAGDRGYHDRWDSYCFNYGKPEVQRFLLSNARYWLEEFRFDGFRFDGVTSMLYRDHGLDRVFSSYDDYFGPNVDEDAAAYLMLVNEMVHELDGRSITIAEDMSGMPGAARPVAEGGLGFDYRLAMGVPDYWIKTIKERRDEQWDMDEVWHTLLNRRHTERHIGYVESHDQAMVGDKTLAFRLMDADQYFNMSKFTPSAVVDRGLALHKMIRLVTFAVAGEGYLNFMGNEFGHPEWIDFPRPGNGYSYQHARRQWSLLDTDHLRYQGLNAFDHAMQRLDIDHGILTASPIERLLAHTAMKLLVCQRGPLTLVFNFHPTESYPDLRVPVPEPRDYRMILNTDDPRFEGHGHVAEPQTYPWQSVPSHGRLQSIQMYLPARTAQVLLPE